MFTRKRIIIAVIVIVGIPALALAWWLLSPLFISQTVDEEFPLASNAVIPVDMTMAEAEEIMVEAASEFNNYDERVPTEMAMPDDAMKMDASVVKVRSGSFRDADSFTRERHGDRISQLGRAEPATPRRLQSYQRAGPACAARAESDPQGRDDVEGYIELGKLKGNMGNQNYFLPEGEDGSGYGSVVIYCRPFHVVFQRRDAELRLASLEVAPNNRESRLPPAILRAAPTSRPRPAIRKS